MVTGTIPQIIANEFPQLNDNVIVKGNDIDITITNNGKSTYLYAIRTGKDYDIVDLDDNANLLPEYDEGDILGIDVIKKLFMQNIMSSLILSFSPLGKIKYGIKDMVDKGKKNVKKGVDKLKKFEKWLDDIIEPQDAQEVIRKQDGFQRAKVGKVDKISSKHGGTYIVLAGNPADKTYSVWTIYRNGKDFRILDSKTGMTADQCLNEYYSYFGEKPKEEPKEEEPKKDDEWKQGDGFMYKVQESLLKSKKEEDNVIDTTKKRKKSKYNGCNVTGCEDGNLTGAGTLVAAGYIFSDLEDFAKYIKGKEFSDDVAKILKKIVATLSQINLKTRKDISTQSEEALALDFSKTNLTSENYNATIQFYKDKIMVWCNALSSLSTEQIIDNILITLNSIIKKQGSR